MAEPEETPERPPWVRPRISKAPKIREIFWCDFWKDAQMPEMWKTRPVVVVSYRNTFKDPCLVVPISSAPQDANPWAHRFDMDGGRRWAICNQPSTISLGRLSQFSGGKVLRMTREDFNQVLEKLVEWLPKPFPLET